MELTTYHNYEEFDQLFSQKIQETKQHMETVVGDFVEIGYLLKRARDTDILRDSGYKNIYEYAQAKYGVDKSEVSRYIRINNNFSQGGYSAALQEQYQDFGVAKLAIMLQLPDAVNEELSPEFSKSEILEIKSEIDEEQKVTDIEVCLEELPAWQQEDIAHQTFLQLFHDEPELYLEVCSVKEHEKELFLALAPAGEKIYTVRVAGTGRLMLSIREDTDVALINVRSGEKETYSKQQITEMIVEMLSCPAGEEKTHWQELYGEDFPEREEAEKTKQKQSRVTKAKVRKEPEKPERKQTEQEPVREESKQTEENAPERTASEPENTENDPKKEPVAPVQLEEESPAWQQDPEQPGKDSEVLSGEVETPPDRENTQAETVLTMEEYEHQMQEYFECFEEGISNARTDVKKEMYAPALNEMEYAIKMIKFMQELYLRKEEA